MIGEGELDEAPMLYIGEEVGDREGPEVDIAVDPLGGTNIAARGRANAVAVIAIGDRERRQKVIDRVRAKGARVKLFGDGDVGASIAAALPRTGIDLFLGTGRRHFRCRY